MTNPTQPAEGMPELPAPAGAVDIDKGPLYSDGDIVGRYLESEDAYTADQMREYGRQCAAPKAPPMPPDARRAIVFFRREFPVTSKPLLDWLAAQGFTKE